MEKPSDFVSPVNFYGNSGDAIAAVNAAYATFINLSSPLGTSDYVGRNFVMLVEYPTEVATSRLSAANERIAHRQLQRAVHVVPPVPAVGLAVGVRGHQPRERRHRARAGRPHERDAPRADRRRGQVPPRAALLLARGPVRRRAAEADRDGLHRRCDPARARPRRRRGRRSRRTSPRPRPCCRTAGRAPTTGAPRRAPR